MTQLSVSQRYVAQFLSSLSSTYRISCSKLYHIRHKIFILHLEDHVNVTQINDTNVSLEQKEENASEGITFLPGMEHMGA